MFMHFQEVRRKKNVLNNIFFEKQKTKHFYKNNFLQFSKGTENLFVSKTRKKRNYKLKIKREI